MSVTMSKAEGVTVLTLTSDSQSVWPPFCQILKGLCYSPVCCSVSQRLKSLQNGSQSVLGVIQIMVGLLFIGLSAILTSSGGGSGWKMDVTGFPYWLGGIFFVVGFFFLLSERYPSPCLLILVVFLHLVGVALAITAIVMYSINVANVQMWWMCQNDDYSYRHRTTATPPSSQEQLLKDRCLEAKALILLLLRGINGVLIVLSVLQLCVAVSGFVLAVKSLRNRSKGQTKTLEDPESLKPLLEDRSSSPSA